MGIEINKIDTNDLKVMKGFVTSYGWVKNKTYSPIDDKVIPDHICADFDDDCHDLPQTHWHCWEDQPECGMCPFTLQEVTEDIENIKRTREYLPDAKIELITNGDVLNLTRIIHIRN